MNFSQIKEQIKNITYFRKRRLQHKVPLAFPLLLNVELTNYCSENCIWCPHNEMTRPKGFMKFDMFKKIIDECAQNERLRRLYVHWMGEPLMHPQSIDLLEYAKSKDVAEMIVIATNGTTLTEPLMEKLVRLKIDELYLSIDAATEETYKRIKGTKSFGKIETNIKQAMALKQKMKAKLPYIRLKFLRTDFNDHEKELFKKKWGNVVDTIFFEEDLNIWNGASERVNDSVANTEAYKKNYGELQVRYPCDRLWYMLAVHWNGKVSPCVCDWDGKSIVGDLSDASIAEVWYNALLTEYRRKHIDGAFQDIEMCKQCTRWGTRHMGDWLLKHKERALSVPGKR